MAVRLQAAALTACLSVLCSCTLPALGAPSPTTAAAAAAAEASPHTASASVLQERQAPQAETYRAAAVATLPPLPTSFPPLPELQVPPLQTARLANGLTVFLLEDREVPLVRGSLLTRGGQVASPPGKVGLATLSAALQRAGGSSSHPGDVLDDRLDELAASIEAAAGPSSLSLSFQCAAEDTPTVLALLAELASDPLLPQAKLDILKSQVLNYLEHRDDSAPSVARRELSKLLQGPSSIYARTPSKAGVASISRSDVRSFLAAWQRPDAALLGLVGDFEAPDMLRQVEAAFGGWRPADGQPAQPPAQPTEEARPEAQPGVVYLVDRPGASQAAVFSGERGISLRDPDVYALDSLSSILNSFGGRLFDRLRSQQGLAYSVAASWDSPADHEGLLVAGGETSHPARFLKELRSALSEATQQAPTASELAAAKSEAVNGFVFNFSSKTQQLSRTLVYQLLRLPQDFLFTYQMGIDAVTGQDVLAAARRHLHPEQEAAVVVADARSTRPELELAGFVVQPLQLPDD